MSAQIQNFPKNLGLKWNIYSYEMCMNAPELYDTQIANVQRIMYGDLLDPTYVHICKTLVLDESAKGYTYIRKERCSEHALYIYICIYIHTRRIAIGSHYGQQIILWQYSMKICLHSNAVKP